MAGYQGMCQIHGEYHDVVLCPTCIQEMFHSMASSAIDMGDLEPNRFSLLRKPVVPSYLESISLGRWEEQTDKDREFLQACGISQE